MLYQSTWASAKKMSPLETSVVERDPHNALIFALTAERLSACSEIKFG